MKRNFAACLAHVLASEGEWSDHPNDPGGATMKGITFGTFRKHHPRGTVEDLRTISDAEVERIYRVDYWEPVGGDHLPMGLDLVAFDAAVNSGVSRGARWLQEAMEVTADGVVGPETIDAAKRAHRINTISRACLMRLAFLRGLSTWTSFGRGWSRRVDRVRVSALEMAVEPPTTWERIKARLCEWLQ